MHGIYEGRMLQAVLMIRNNSKSSIRTYHALDVVLSILQKLTHLILAATL